MAEWAALAQRWRPLASPTASSSAAAACEDGMDLLCTQVQYLTDPLGLNSPEEGAEEGGGGAGAGLGELAAAVRRRDPAMFADVDNAGSPASSELLKDRLAVLTEVSQCSYTRVRHRRCPGWCRRIWF